jgi:hypothetical protein
MGEADVWREGGDVDVVTLLWSDDLAGMSVSLL